MTIVPPSRPKIQLPDAMRLIDPFKLDQYPVKLLGIRGYYKQTMGNPLTNDRGIYDDAILVLAPDFIRTHNANTDPSVKRKGIAVMKAGTVTLYKIGLHGISGPNPYKALRQHSNVTVIRDEVGEVTDSPQNRFWINIHKGSRNNTSSLGCQTIFPDQWDLFLDNVEGQMKKYKQEIIPYVLVEY